MNQKQPYTAPQLQNLGKITEQTAVGSGCGGDAKGGTSREGNPGCGQGDLRRP